MGSKPPSVLYGALLEDELQPNKPQGNGTKPANGTTTAALLRQIAKAPGDRQSLFAPLKNKHKTPALSTALYNLERRGLISKDKTGAWHKN
jgi:hypothetical protein